MSFAFPPIPGPGSFTPKVTVTITDIEPDGTTLFKQSSDLLGIYTDYSILNSYNKDSHKYMMGIASPAGFQGDSVAFVQLTAPTLIWTVDWEARRFNIQPEIPDPYSRNPNWELLYDHWEVTNITIAGDGVTPLYVIGGTYIYGCKRPDALTYKDLRYPMPPWIDSNNTFQRTVQNTTLIDGIMTTTNGGTAGFGEVLISPTTLP